MQELIGSVREGGIILRGEVKSARSFQAETPNVRQIRGSYQLSQPEFAALLGMTPLPIRIGS